MAKISDVRANMARWIDNASEHSISVESRNNDMTEDEENRGGELAEEAESLAEQATKLGPEGAKLAYSFALLHKQWMDTGLPPRALQKSFARAARIA
jgi:hypothetical protein